MSVILCRAGFNTYLLDWGVPTAADRHLLLEDYIDGYMKRVVNQVCALTRTDQLSLLGYCMGGTLSTIFTALHPQRVRNLILLAAGIDFATREGLLNLWTDPKYFDVDRFVDVYGNCPAEFLQSSFQMLKPVQNLLEKPINFFERLDDDAFVDDYFAMETWLNDNSGPRRSVPSIRQRPVPEEPADAEPPADRKADREPARYHLPRPQPDGQS